MNTGFKTAEYIWLDGTEPTQRLRSKTRIVRVCDLDGPRLEDFPQWSFDGSSTGQAEGDDSDLLLEPVRFVPDPLRDGGFLVLCEVLDGDGAPHASNRRAYLREVLAAGADAEAPMFGFEQEYTLYAKGRPLGWPETGFPGPQGPYYCGVGAEEAHGREMVEAHGRACLDAGLLLFGINAEVMPGQWEFQLGHRGFGDEVGDPLRVSDDLWIARWLLLRIGEQHGARPRLDPKPEMGDWNGAGNHANFSTRSTRDERYGLVAIKAAIDALEKAHPRHIRCYGAGNEQRLTGLHETCSIAQFKSGVANRGASIRIPRQVLERGHGYLEDRRPAANCDPYVVCAEILRTVCGIHLEAGEGKPRAAAA